MHVGYLFNKTIENYTMYIINYTGNYNSILGEILNAVFVENINEFNEYLNQLTIIGPKLNFKSPWCSNMLEILKKSNITNVSRIEKFRLVTKDGHEEYDNMTENIYKTIPTDLDMVKLPDLTKTVKLENINQVNKELNLGFDSEDIEYYTSYFRNIDREPTDVELFDLAQSNSEHSRHWIFNGKLAIDGSYINETLFQMVKKPLKKNKNNSLIAFSDNSSAIQGFTTTIQEPLFKNKPSNYCLSSQDIHFTLTAETHNFPTGVSPFQGAETGIGGRIRDNIAIGKGGNIIAGTAGYCVGKIDFKNKNRAFIIENDASNGASDYGNKIGEPIILGFTRSFKQIIDNNLYEWQKPIMFTAGLGTVLNKNLNKENPKENMIITRIGGPAYRIGLGGGSSSSKSANEEINASDLSAVQRGDAEMENKVVRVIRSLSTCGKNIIKSIHDQGAGGMANVTKEIVSPLGGTVYLEKVDLGDKSLSSLEIWGAEYQEQVTILIEEEDKNYVTEVCKRENVPVNYVGYVNTSGNIKVIEKNNKTVVDLNLDSVLENIPQKAYEFNKVQIKLKPLNIPTKEFEQHIVNIFDSIEASSKRFLTNKVDRSVTGLIAQQQCVGPLHTPLSNYGIIATNYTNLTGCVTAIGEQPIKAFIDSEKMARMTVGEMLTNIIFAKIDKIEDIKCSGNWMWSPKLEGEGVELYKAVKSLTVILSNLGIAIDGGKDSMSMHKNSREGIIKTPRTLVMSAYASMPNITVKLTPDFKEDKSNIVFVDLGFGKNRLGASILSQIYDQIGDDCPDFENITNFKYQFNTIQKLIKSNKIISGHDRSDGGLITTLLEMSFAGNKGFNLDITSKATYLEYFFNEELGIILEVPIAYTDYVVNKLSQSTPVTIIGAVTDHDNVSIKFNNEEILNTKMTILRNSWEKNSFNFEKHNIPDSLALEENKLYSMFDSPCYYIPDSIYTLINEKIVDCIPRVFKVAILREEGSNGDKEMAAAFSSAGFQVWDVNTYDLINNPYFLNNFTGLVFVGGFSFSDVSGSANGWYQVIMNNPVIKNQLIRFYKRTNTFSLGVCNGCQVMTKLGIINGIKNIECNDSGRFESRFSTVKIPKNNSIMLSNLRDLQLGIWVAHGEGKFDPIYENNIINSYSKKPDVFDNNSIVMQYVDFDGKPTEKYPHNPNGSRSGIAAVVSHDGRHIAMMPHPERCFLDWQFPWMPKKSNNRYSPWYLMFKNAYKWCNNT